MDRFFIQQVEDHEQQLQAALLTKDLAALSHLLANDLLLTLANGQRFDKQACLTAIETGDSTFAELVQLTATPSVLCAHTVAMSAEMQLGGQLMGTALAGRYRMTRVWTGIHEQHWQLRLAQLTQITG